MTAPHPPPPNIEPLAVTMGEPGGVGGEIIVKAWRALSQTGPHFFAVDDPDRLEKLGVATVVIDAPSQAGELFATRLPVLPIGSAAAATPGKVTGRTAGLVVKSIETAVDYCLKGTASGVVTSPIQKHVLMENGFSFPGHTEFLASLTSSAPMPTLRGSPAPKQLTRGPVMMIAGPGLKAVPVTIHLPLKDAVRRLNSDLIFQIAMVTAESLVCDFGFTNPRIAVSGLNPHAGENGALGEEDAAIIAPAIDRLTKAGVDAVGPLPADTMFHEEARATYDAAVCMYHDQALIPAKTLGFHDAVNVTLGLPIIRTSPDHGTALDIAGKDLARPDSMIAAIRLAAVMAARRRDATS